MVGLLVCSAIVARSHHVKHAIVFAILERRINAHVVSVCHQALSDFLLVDVCCIRQFRNGRMALVFLFKLIDLVIDFVERANLVKR